MAQVDIFSLSKRYDVIYADPPWSYRQCGSERGKRGMAKWHYSTMTMDDLCSLPIQNISSESAILFLWATFPQLPDALQVIDVWGFDYKTAAFVWVKQNRKSSSDFWGMGAYTRANAEPCLLALRKSAKAKEIIKSHSVHQIIHAPIEEHSKKPDEARQRIDELLGGGTKNRAVCSETSSRLGLLGG